MVSLATERTVRPDRVAGLAARALDGLPLLVLPAAALAIGPSLPRWGFLWLLAYAIWLGCKWLTWRTSGRPFSLGYLLLWPGMDARAFLGPRDAPRPRGREWAEAALKTGMGAAILWGLTPAVFGGRPLLQGWVGLLGLGLLLLFGLFHLIALLWRLRGVHAEHIHRAPLLATSLGEFWGRRWNRAFRRLANDHLFMPLRRRLGVAGAMAVAFLVSGLLHDLVLSVPAGGGYGLPTGFFLLQAAALLFERTALARRLGLRGGRGGRALLIAVTAVPAFWLFHPPFVREVIHPFLGAIGAL